MRKIINCIENFFDKKIAIKTISILPLIIIIIIMLIIVFIGNFGFTFEFKGNVVEFANKNQGLWSFWLSIISLFIAIVTAGSLLISNIQTRSQLKMTRESIDDSFLAVLDLFIESEDIEVVTKVIKHPTNVKNYIVDGSYQFSEIDGNKYYLLSFLKFKFQLKNLSTGSAKGLSILFSHNFLPENRFFERESVKEIEIQAPALLQREREYYSLNQNICLLDLVDEKMITEVNKEIDFDKSRETEILYNRLSTENPFISREECEERALIRCYKSLFKKQLILKLIKKSFEFNITYFDLKNRRYKMYTEIQVHGFSNIFSDEFMNYNPVPVIRKKDYKLKLCGETIIGNKNNK